MKQRVNHSTGEREAARTTIVGGRPPGSGRDNARIPRGMEVLVKKAAVDPGFRGVLVERRAEAAGLIGLELTPSEKAMIETVPERQLLSIVSQTDVPDRERRAFLGKAAAAMLAVLGVGVAGGCDQPATTGIRPDDPPAPSRGIQPDVPENMPATDGIRPDIPDGAVRSAGVRPDAPSPPPATPTTKGIRPDVPKNVPAPTGIRPDMPAAKPKGEKKPEPPPPPSKGKIQVSRGVRPDIPRKAGE